MSNELLESRRKCRIKKIYGDFIQISKQKELRVFGLN